MVDTFTWTPDDGPTGDIDFRVRTAKFGDGYEQVIGDGLNIRTEKWPLKFDRAQADIVPIKAFLDAHPGYISFWWTPPGPAAAQGLYRCTGYTIAPRSGLQVTLACRFEQAFAP